MKTVLWIIAALAFVFSILYFIRAKQINEEEDQGEVEKVHKSTYGCTISILLVVTLITAIIGIICAR